jgi:hypothetical protein
MSAAAAVPCCDYSDDSKSISTRKRKSSRVYKVYARFNSGILVISFHFHNIVLYSVLSFSAVYISLYINQTKCTIFYTILENFYLVFCWQSASTSANHNDRKLEINY